MKLGAMQMVYVTKLCILSLNQNQPTKCVGIDLKLIDEALSRRYHFTINIACKVIVKKCRERV